MDIYTIGHSIRNLNTFIKILISNKIRCLVDVRSYPNSKRVPQYNMENLKESLGKYMIQYIHIPELGGRRRVKTNIHSSIEVSAFAGYADYMMTKSFKKGLEKLKKVATKCKTAYMCAEALWWMCHRRMISDRLTFDGWNVYHLGLKKVPILHTIWNIARLGSNGEIYYDK